MVETKFTPGPWNIQFDDTGGYDSFYSGYLIGAPDYKQEICTVETQDWRFDHEPTWEESHAENDRAAADAALIAAAPDMYAALEAAINWRGLDGDGISDPVREQLYVAIAKARGEQ